MVHVKTVNEEHYFGHAYLQAKKIPHLMARESMKPKRHGDEPIINIIVIITLKINQNLL